MYHKKGVYISHIYNIHPCRQKKETKGAVCPNYFETETKTSASTRHLLKTFREGRKQKFLNFFSSFSLGWYISTSATDQLVSPLLNTIYFILYQFLSTRCLHHLAKQVYTATTQLLLLLFFKQAHLIVCYIRTTKEETWFTCILPV